MFLLSSDYLKWSQLLTFPNRHVQSSISSVSDEYLNQVRKQSSKSQQCDSFAMNRFLPDEETSRIGPVKVPEFSFNAGPQFSISRTSSSMMIDVDKVQEDRKPFVASLLNGPPQSTGAALARRDTLSAQRLTSVRRKSAVMIESMAHILPADFLPEGSFSGTKGLVTADQRPSFTAGKRVILLTKALCSVAHI